MNLRSRIATIVVKLTLLSLLFPISTALIAENPPLSTPQVPQTQAQPQESSDRSGSSGAAQAAAMAGAAMAGLGCIMGLEAASKEQNPSTKNMMQMMAMQQCAQAAQNAASAAQNGDQKKKLDSPPPLNQPPPFQAPEIKVPEDGKATDLSKFAQNTKSSDSDKSKDDFKIKPFENPIPANTEKPARNDKNSTPIAALTPAKSIPELIAPKTITTGKDNKEEDSNSINQASRTLGSALTGKGSADDLLKKALAENGTNPNETPMIRLRGATGKEESGSGGGSSASEGGGGGSDSPFENLLAQMLGGGPGAAGDIGFGGGSDIINIGKDKNNQPKINIFQFASSVYSELTHTQNRIATRRSDKPVSVVNQILGSTNYEEGRVGSVPNLVTKAPIR